MFDEGFYRVCRNVENSGMFAKDFIQHRYYGSMYTSLWQLESVTEVFMSEVVLTNLKI